jgi:hypothetical protein
MHSIDICPNPLKSEPESDCKRHHQGAIADLLAAAHEAHLGGSRNPQLGSAARGVRKVTLGAELLTLSRTNSEVRPMIDELLTSVILLGAGLSIWSLVEALLRTTRRPGPRSPSVPR